MLSQQKIKPLVSKSEMGEICIIKATWTHPNQVKFEIFFLGSNISNVNSILKLNQTCSFSFGRPSDMRDTGVPWETKS